MRLLLVEDEKKVASFIKKGLGEEGHAVDWASDGESGLYMGLDTFYGLIILDVNLPIKDGLTVLSDLPPVIVPVVVLDLPGQTVWR
jgi:DNA-binding response OmpR family regulator